QKNLCIPKHYPSDIDFWGCITRLVFEQPVNDIDRLAGKLGENFGRKPAYPFVTFPIVLGFREVQTGLCDGLQLASPANPLRLVDHRQRNHLSVKFHIRKGRKSIDPAGRLLRRRREMVSICGGKRLGGTASVPSHFPPACSNRKELVSRTARRPSLA